MTDLKKWTYQEFKETIENKDSFKSFWAIKNVFQHPELYGDVVLGAIKAGDMKTLLPFLQNQMIETVYQTTSKPRASFLSEILAQKKRGLFREIFQFDTFHPHEISQLKMLKKALGNTMKEGEPGFKNIDLMFFAEEKITSEEKGLISFSVSEMTPKVYKAVEGGSYPPVVFASTQTQSCRFEGLDPEVVQKEGALAVLVRAIEHTEPDLTDIFDEHEMPEGEELEIAKEQAKDIDLDQFYDHFEQDVSKLEDLMKLTEQFSKKPEGVLLQHFIDKGGIFVLSQDEGQALSGMSHGGVVMMTNVSEGTFYHELLHEIEKEKRQISHSPLMDKVYDYVDYCSETVKTGAFSSFWRKMYFAKRSYNESQKQKYKGKLVFQSEMIPCMASLLKENTVMPQLPKTLLKYMTVYGKARMEKNEARQAYLEKALERTDIDITKNGDQMICYLEDVMKNKVRSAEVYRNNVATNDFSCELKEIRYKRNLIALAFEDKRSR